MLINSLKQLFRRPMKLIIFFLLMTGASALLVFGAGMYIKAQRQLAAADSQFTTTGTVTQPSIGETYSVRQDDCTGVASYVDSVEYSERIHPEQLDFEGSTYLQPPAMDKYYTAYMPDTKDALYGNQNFKPAIVEYKALEDGDTKGPFRAEITKVLYEGDLPYVIKNSGMGKPVDDFWEIGSADEFGPGAIINVCTHYSHPDFHAEAGKTYISTLLPDAERDPLYRCETHHVVELLTGRAMFSTQCDREGNPIPGPLADLDPNRIDEVTENFYDEGQPGQYWLNMAKEQEMLPSIRYVLGARSNTINRCYLWRGREFTQEELDSGAKVCLVTYEFAQANLLYEGSKVKIPFYSSSYGYLPDRNNKYWFGSSGFAPPTNLSMLDANGEVYEPFFEEEYEVIGVVSPYSFGEEGFLVPEKSITASDEGLIAGYDYMAPYNCRFQLKNGTMAQFEEDLYRLVPEAANLEITYNDQGYSEIMDSFSRAIKTAFLLFMVGLLSSAAIVALLLYFFIVREKRRTAIERSLGCSARQCRVSLLVGVMLVAVLASAIGSIGAGTVLEDTQFIEQAEEDADEVVSNQLDENGEPIIDWGLGGVFNFNSRYSLWALNYNWITVESMEDITAPGALYVAVPLALCLVILVCALLLINRSLKVDPILLLSEKT